MKRFLCTTLISGFLMAVTGVIAQVGIGTATPDSSAVLDLSSTDRGFLLPRLSTEQRDLNIESATALMIYHNSIDELQINSGSLETPVWTNLNGGSNATILSISDASDISCKQQTKVQSFWQIEMQRKWQQYCRVSLGRK